MHRTFRPFFVVLVLGLVATGCRTYGGFGSNEALYDEIQRANDRFADDLARAQAELSTLSAATAESPHVETLAEQYAALVAAHQAIVEEHQELTRELSPGSSYRALSNAYRAVVADQQLLRRQYQHALRNATTPDTQLAGRPYAIVPPYYVRIADGRERLTAHEVLRRIRGAEGADLPNGDGDGIAPADDSPADDADGSPTDDAGRTDDVDGSPASDADTESTQTDRGTSEGGGDAESARS